MYTGLMFIIYIAAAFIGLLGVGIVLLLMTKGENRRSPRYVTAMNFALAVFMQCVLYVYFYFCDVVNGEYTVPLPIRILDYFLCAAIFFFWLRTIDVLSDGRKSSIRSWSWIVGISLAVSGVGATIFFMDAYYGFKSEAGGMAYTAIECVLAVIVVLVILKYTIGFIHFSVSSGRRIYVGVVSATLVLWEIQQCFIDNSLYLGVYQSAWSSQVLDTTGLAMAIAGLASFLYLFREDFSPIFYSGSGGVNIPVSEMDPLELAAMQHHLTIRELEVLRLVYMGKNNPEIADELCISRNTVKKHLKNIFEKMGCSSRMELVYIVNKGKA